MGEEDYRLLVSTLDNLPKLQEKLISKKNEASSFEKKITDHKKKVDVLRRALEERDDDVKAIHTKIADTENEIISIGKQLEEFSLKVADIKEANQRKMAEYDKKLLGHQSEARNANNNYILKYTFIFLASIFWLAFVFQYDMEDYHDLVDGGFDCENGEQIHGSLVLNGVLDCSNGHDEEASNCGDIRDKDCTDAQVYQKLQNHYRIPWYTMLSAIIPIGLIYLVSRNSNKMKDDHEFLTRRINLQRNRLEDEERKLPRQTQSLKDKIKRKKSQIDNFRGKMKKLTRLDLELEDNVKALAEMNGSLSKCNEAIEALEKEIEDAQNAISHLIPYSYLLKK